MGREKLRCDPGTDASRRAPSLRGADSLPLGMALILSQIGQSRPAGLKTETLRIGSRARPPPQRQAPLLLPCKMPVPATHGKAARAGFYLADIVVRPIRSASDNRRHLKYTL